MKVRLMAELDIRLSSLPTVWRKWSFVVGHSLQELSTLKDLGLQQKITFDGNHDPSAIWNLLFTGPTGSGKTTTLYAILNELARGKSTSLPLKIS
ncbi:MAG: ATPase, T2SS/T4P/T4SS family [Holdemania massiliensis]